MASASNTASGSESLPSNTSDTANQRSSNQAPSMEDVNINPSSPYFIPPSDVVQPMHNFPVQPDQMHYLPQPQFNAPQSQFSAPQCPITQNQCEQLLSYLASQSKVPQPTHQAASVLSPLSGAAGNTGFNSSMPYLANFSAMILDGISPYFGNT
nr:hypothetical protein CFP56_04737 [Quercus suber]